MSSSSGISATYVPPSFSQMEYGMGGMGGKATYFGGKPPLSQAIGYIVVLGWGAFFSILTTVVVCIERKMSGKNYTSERFK